MLCTVSLWDQCSFLVLSFHAPLFEECQHETRLADSYSKVSVEPKQTGQSEPPILTV